MSAFELEFFLTKPSKPWIILNANKEMTERLGFCIDQNDPNNGHLNLGNGYDLVTDGTAAELRWFQEHNAGNLPVDTYYKPIHALKVLEGLQHTWWPFYEVGRAGHVYGKKTVFDSPGNVFSSAKELRNAYTGQGRYSAKKEEANVTVRTAGLHLHFSVNPRAIMDRYTFKNLKLDLNRFIFGDTRHTDELVKILDSIYRATIVNSHETCFTRESQERVDRYQTLGDYRIRSGNMTKTGLQTLEYRQLDAYQANAGTLRIVQTLIDIFQYRAKEYLDSVIN